MLAASPGGHYQRFDSMAVDAWGNVCVATLIHGGISIISPDGQLQSHVSLPDRFTTNLCFGGADRRTVYVTLSGSGKLIAIDDWPLPGLALNYPA
jgi:gluconolactonase